MVWMGPGTRQDGLGWQDRRGVTVNGLGRDVIEQQDWAGRHRTNGAKREDRWREGIG